MVAAGDLITFPSKQGAHELHIKDCVELMRSLEESSIDAIVTDPPYGIGFMGRKWDKGLPGPEFSEQALRVLKPGGFCAAFAATRTVHRLGVLLEDAGLEIRDIIAWTNWQGFPKSLAADKAIGGEEGKPWEGWGSALKPAFEPCIVARKPLDGTYAENALKWGTGFVNIDGCRYGYGDPAWPGPQDVWDVPNPESAGSPFTPPGDGRGSSRSTVHDLGRFPANLYQCPKPSTAEREAGCSHMGQKSAGEMCFRPEGSKGLESPRAGGGRTSTGRGNYHPTVKPLRLMRWLVRLLGGHNKPGLILEPFCGSGTTLLACELEGLRCIAAEMDPGYAEIIRSRYKALPVLRKLMAGESMSGGKAEAEMKQGGLDL